MATSVALLRGINVSGRNKVPMEDLRRLAGDLGLERIRSYLQSGNLVFEGGGSEVELAQRLMSGIEDRFGLAVPVVVRTAARMIEVGASSGLFDSDGAVPDDSPTHFHVTFLAGAPDPSGVERLQARADRYGSDRFRVAGQEVYLYVPKGYGDTRLTNDLFERELGASATTRGWRTVTALAALANT